MKNINGFRTGTARHLSEDDVFEVFDEGAVSADFVETWEFVEGQVADAGLPSITSAAAPGVSSNTNYLRIANNEQKNRDSVLEYNDRLPNTGQ